MPRQQDTFTIDDNKYTFSQLDPRRAAKVYAFLLGRFGATVGDAIGALGKLKGFKSIQDADLDMSKLGSALAKLFQSMDDDKTLEHVDTLLSSVLFEGSNMNLDHINFQGRMKHLTKVTQKALEVNYADFLEGSRGIVEKLKATVTLIQGKQTSTGSSGAQSSKA
jgi:hypothetical protein